MPQHPATRNTISLEEAEILSHQACSGAQYLMRLQAPEIAKDARPGSFVHLRCDPALPMRRPMSIMRADARAGWIDILYKAHGLGTRLLAKRRESETLSVLGPIGVPFKTKDYCQRPLLIGGGVGIPPMVFLAEHIKNNHKAVSPLVIMGSEIPFPFQTRPSRMLIEGMPGDVIATMPLLEDWGIPCRLTSLSGFAGCYTGYVTDLARLWLEQLSPEQRRAVEIFTCGHAHAEIRGGPGPSIRFALPGFHGRIHGLCRRRLCRLCHKSGDRIGARHAAGLCRRPGVRGRFRFPFLSPFAETGYKKPEAGLNKPIFNRGIPANRV